MPKNIRKCKVCGNLTSFSGEGGHPEYDPCCDCGAAICPNCSTYASGLRANDEECYCPDCAPKGLPRVPPKD